MVRWKPASWQKKQPQPTNKVEDAVVGGYKKVENAFVDAFLEKVDEPESKDSEKKSNAKQGTAGTAQMYLPFSFIFKIIETQRQ